MKTANALFVALPLLAISLTGCTQISQTPQGGFTLTSFGGDMEQFQAESGNGINKLAFTGMNNSKSASRLADIPEKAIQWSGMKAIAGGWFGTKNTQTVQDGITSRHSLTETGLTKRAEIDLLKSTQAAEPAAAVLP